MKSQDRAERFRSTSVVFLTAGETPSTQNVLYSQVYSVASALARMSPDVRWYAVLPLESLKQGPAGRVQLSLVKQQCGLTGVFFKALVFGSTLFRFRMLQIRWVYINACAMVLSRLVVNGELQKKVVINARSYYATSIALKIRDHLVKRGHDVRVCFDMRGILSLTFPASYPQYGYAIYGAVKEWEARLINDADISLNNRVAAIKLAKLEYGSDIVYLPVSGFSRESIQQRCFDQVWGDKVIAFVGSFSRKFHDMGALQRIAESLSRHGFRVEVITDKPESVQGQFPVRTVSHSEMPAVFAQLSAVVIPGRRTPESLFDRMALRAYSAPTKMSEGLSAGVPIIVGSCFPEIATFVRESGCGLVYDVEHDTFERVEAEQLGEEKLWRTLNDRACGVSADFSQERVLEIYTNAWAPTPIP